jgi:DNA end-binding protein Ku
MARPLWTGSLSFGLVNVPVALHSAVRDHGVHFRELHEPDHSPIETRRVCAQDGSEVPVAEIAKGYELEDGRWVLLTDEDLRAAAPRQSSTIDIERFVYEEEVDPLYYERPYLLVPSDEGATRAYVLLQEVMSDAGRVALGRFVLRAKEHLVSIRSREGVLSLTTMRFHDELRPTAEIAGEELERAKKPTPTEVKRAVAIIEELGVSFDPRLYRDEHRAHLQRIIKSKQKGLKVPKPTKPVQPQEPVMTAPDLMGALEQSLAEIRNAKTKAKGKKGGSGRGSGARPRAKDPSTRSA